MADFIDVPIDVTAEQIEEMAKRQVDTVAKKGSKNLITSGAVADVKIDSENILPDAVNNRHLANDSVDTLQVKNGAITEDKIAPGAVTSGKLGQYAVTTDAIAPSAVKENNLGTSAVTTGKIADDAVTEEKIADNSVDYNHLKDKAVIPEKLDREYVRLHQSSAGIAIRFESQFHNYLVTGAKNEIDELEPFRKICMFSVASTDGLLSVIGTGRFYGFYISKSAFAFTRLGANPQTFLALWNADKITSIELVGDNAIVDHTYNPESINAQSGLAVYEAFELFKLNYQQIKKVTLKEVTYKALLEAVLTYGAIMFDTFTERFTGAETELNLPLGCYVAFYEHGQTACWHFDSGVLYRLVGYDLFDTGDYKFYVTSSFVELENKVGDIDTALDNIIAIQNSYIGGADK